VAKVMKNVASSAAKAPKKKALQRQLEAAKVAHGKAEQKTGKLRGRLERAEARLAKTAEDLVAAQSLLDQVRAPAPSKQEVQGKVPAKVSAAATSPSASTPVPASSASEPAAPSAKPAAAKKPVAQASSRAGKPTQTAKARPTRKAADPSPNGMPSEQVVAEAKKSAGADSVRPG